MDIETGEMAQCKRMLSEHRSEHRAVKCDRELSAQIIQCSRVNENLCREAEAGRIHGEGVYENGFWTPSFGGHRINLQQSFKFVPSIVPCCPFDYFPDGEPLIETWDMVSPGLALNGQRPWDTQFIYLRASIFSQLLCAEKDILGNYQREYEQAKSLGGIWGLSGKWGEPNRLSAGNWHQDDSWLTTFGDSGSNCALVFDENGCPRYGIALLTTDTGTLILPYRYLKRENWGPRRVFFPPEEDITIWGANRIAAPETSAVVLTCAPYLQANSLPDYLAVGCLPGGTDSIVATDFSILKNKECIVPFDSDDNYSIEFAARLLARLREMFISPYIIQENEQPKEIKLSKFSQLVSQHGIFVPEEIRNDYLGDITEAVASYVPIPVINGFWNAGDMIAIDADESIMPLITSHFAKALSVGSYLFDNLVEITQKFPTALFVDNKTASAAYHCRGTSAKICDTRFLDGPDNELLARFKTLIGSSRIVIFTTKTFKQFDEIINYCRRREITVMVVLPPDDSENRKRVSRMADKTISAKLIGGNSGRAVAVDLNGYLSVEAIFDNQGQLTSARELSFEKHEQVNPTKSIPAAPPSFELSEDQKKLPPEKRLAQLKLQMQASK